MKVSFKIAECSLFGAKIKKHETRKRFRTFYMFLSTHCVEFLHPSRSSYHAHQAIPRGSRDGESVNMR